MRINEVGLKKVSSASTSSSIVTSYSRVCSNQYLPPSQRVYLSSYYESVRREENWKRLKQIKDDEEAESYVNWLNSQFSTRLLKRKSNGEEGRLLNWLHVSNLSKDLCDGLRVIYLLDLIYGVCLTKEFGDRNLGCMQLHKIKNHETCLKYLRRAREIKCVGINAPDLAGGNLKMLIGLLFLIKLDANQPSVGLNEHKSLAIFDYYDEKKITCQSTFNSSIKSEPSEVLNLSEINNNKEENKDEVKIVKNSEMNELNGDNEVKVVCEELVKGAEMLFCGMEDSGYTSGGRRNTEDSSHEEVNSKEDESERISTPDLIEDLKK